MLRLRWFFWRKQMKIVGLTRQRALFRLGVLPSNGFGLPRALTKLV
jgi:hypothetical protein